MKWNLPKLRAKAWRILNHQSTTIVLRKIKVSQAISWDDESGSLEIFVDPYKVNIAEAVVHEIFHAIFDKHTTSFTVYDIHERWYTALEKPFFQGMTKKEKHRWRKAIERKMPKTQIPKKLAE